MLPGDRENGLPMERSTSHTSSSSAIAKERTVFQKSFRRRQSRSVRLDNRQIPAKSQLPSRDCTPRALPRASRSGRHVGLWPPRNDKSESFTPQNAYRKSCQSAWRSLSAATDAIGACHFNDSLYGSGVRSRAGLSPLLQRIAGSYGKNSTFHSQFSPSGGRLSPNRYLQ